MSDDFDLIGGEPDDGMNGSVGVLDDLVRQRRVENGEVSFHLQDVHRGVTVAWLAQVFAMDPTTVKKRLADCPPMERRKAGYTYSVPQAAAYLVKPVFDVKAYLKGMKPAELPAQLQKEYWDAALKRQRWEERAGQLWRTDSVLEVLGETLKNLKFTLQLWADNLERQTGLTRDQRKVLIGMVDALQEDLHKSLVTMAEKRHTPSIIAELESEED